MAGRDIENAPHSDQADEACPISPLDETGTAKPSCIGSSSSCSILLVLLMGGGTNLTSLVLVQSLVSRNRGELVGNPNFIMGLKPKVSGLPLF